MHITAATITSYLAGFSKRHVKSTTETLGVGTRKAMSVSFPLNAGRHLRRNDVMLLVLVAVWLCGGGGFAAGAVGCVACWGSGGSSGRSLRYSDASAGGTAHLGR